MKLSKTTQAGLIVLIWAIIALIGTVIYQWLHSIGFIYEMPHDDSCYYLSNGVKTLGDDIHFNMRKVIFGILGTVSFVIMFIKLISLAELD